MTFYNMEHSSSTQKLQALGNYINTEALDKELHIVENQIFKQLLQIGKILLREFIEIKGTGKEKPPNDKGLPFHSIKKRNYLSIFGNIIIPRAYFWKRESSGVYPLDAELNLPNHHHSYLLSKWIQRHIAEGPYEEAINSIGDLLDLKITKRVVQQVTVEASQKIDNYYKQKADFIDEGSHLIVQADCKGVIMIPSERPKTKEKDEFVRRGKGVSKIGIRKDTVVTTDFSITPVSRTPEDVLKGLMLINSDKKKEKQAKPQKIYNPINKQITGTMFGKAKAFEDLANRIQTRDKENKKPIYVLIDGAKSLEQGFLNEFKKRGWESRIQGYCLDIVHATEYLWDASTALYGEVSPKRVTWVRSALLKLLESKVQNVNRELENKISSGQLSEFTKRRLKRTLTYFKNHIHMMDYSRYLKEGFPIASGAIEGACNTLVKDRTDRSGMQWTKIGAQAVISLRSAHCNKDWEEYWEFYMQNQSIDLYGESKDLVA